MKIDINTKTTKEADIKYFCLDVNARYLEDATVNGEEDICYDDQVKGKESIMPFMRTEGKERFWKIKIDVETGAVVDWPKDKMADIHYKVCDEGTYWLEDANGNEIHKIESYVPGILDFYGDSYGDYLVMTIKEGRILEWENDWFKNHIDIFLENEGC
jgi:hypothetical protein